MGGYEDLYSDEFDFPTEEQYAEARRMRELREGFWDRRDELKQIQTAATDVGRSPWGVLGVVLSRVVCCIPPHVVLPPITGEYGSLNLMVALTGRPGSGKSTSIGLGKRLSPNDIERCMPASGEAIQSKFTTRDKEGHPIFHCESAWMCEPEVQSLIARLGQQGSTLLGALLKAVVAEEQGRDKGLRTDGGILASHRYRMGIVLGVQPKHMAQLINLQGDGFPQRAIWLPVRDPGKRSQRSLHPAPITPTKFKSRIVKDPLGDPSKDVPEDKFEVIKLPESVVRELIDFDDDDTTPELDTHMMFLRLKVAGILMWMNGRSKRITAEDWELAGVVMDVSHSTRTQVMKEGRAAKRSGARRSKAEQRVDDQRAEDDAFSELTDELRDKCLEVTRKYRVGESINWTSFTNAIRHKRFNTDHFEAALALLVEHEVLSHHADPRGGGRGHWKRL